jgi:hypothetical protein
MTPVLFNGLFVEEREKISKEGRNAGMQEKRILFPAFLASCLP